MLGLVTQGLVNRFVYGLFIPIKKVLIITLIFLGCITFLHLQAKADTTADVDDSLGQQNETNEIESDINDSSDPGLFDGWSIMIGVKASAPDPKITYKGKKTRYGVGGWGEPKLTYGAAGANNFFGDSNFGYQHLFQTIDFEAYEENEDKTFDKNIKLTSSGFMYSPALFYYFGDVNGQNFFKIGTTDLI